MAKGNLAWVAWLDGDLSEAREQGAAAIKLWQDMGGPGRFCFWWIALWPLLGVALAEGQTLEAVTYARALLDPTQQLLPVALTEVLEGAVQAWEQGQTEASRAQLNSSIKLAQEMDYL